MHLGGSQGLPNTPNTTKANPGASKLHLGQVQGLQNAPWSNPGRPPKQPGQIQGLTNCTLAKPVARTATHCSSPAGG
eukprot:1116483-Lingulodinium_polyedra.AAC.1